MFWRPICLPKTKEQHNCITLLFVTKGLLKMFSAAQQAHFSSEEPWKIWYNRKTKIISLIVAVQLLELCQLEKTDIQKIEQLMMNSCKQTNNVEASRRYFYKANKRQSLLAFVYYRLFYTVHNLQIGIIMLTSINFAKKRLAWKLILWQLPKANEKCSKCRKETNQLKNVQVSWEVCNILQLCWVSNFVVELLFVFFNIIGSFFEKITTDWLTLFQVVQFK